MIDNALEYLNKAWQTVEPIRLSTIVIFNYLLFPASFFKTMFIAVGIAILLDLYTRIRTNIYKANGYKQAITNGKISSKLIRQGLIPKIIDYFIIFILVGQAYRIGNAFPQVIAFSHTMEILGSIIYGVIFLTEMHSIVENLCERGANLGWLSKLISAKKEDLKGGNDNEDKD